jgi:hypothetical protein
MPVVQLKDGNGNLSYWQVKGSGTEDDPYVPTGLDEGVLQLLRQLLQSIADPGWLDKSANQLRAQVTGTITAAAITIAAAQTLATLTTLSNIDAYQGKLLMVGMDIDAWANTVRRTIS